MSSANTEPFSPAEALAQFHDCEPDSYRAASSAGAGTEARLLPRSQVWNLSI
jgi:hypothetical protein